MIKAVIFDFDGVLVESVGIKTMAFRRLFAGEDKRAIGLIAAYHLKHTGVSRFEKFRHIYKKILKRRLTKEIFSRLCREFSRIVEEEVVRAPYVAGARDFLIRHSGRYLCFTVSATPENEIKRIIRKRNMGIYFKRVYGAPRDKSECVKRILRAYRISEEHAVYIGDSPSDREAAGRNRIIFIARIKGGPHPLSGARCPKIRDLRNLKTVISRLR